MGALDLNKRGLVVSLLVLAVAIAAVSGVVLGNLSNASSRGTVTVTIQGDSKVYSSQEAPIPIQWNNVNLGENTKTVTINNQANVNLKTHLTFSSPNLPVGWTLTFSLDNQIVPAGQSAKGTLTLTVPDDAVVGNYNWGAKISFETLRR